jgi:hypothetical protein
VNCQTDQDFHLWIGLDSISPGAAADAMGGNPRATWVQSEPGDTPAQVRQRAFERIAQCCDVVVMVDSDDILHPSRVASARKSLESSDLAGCALRLVDACGNDLGLTFGLPATTTPEDVFPRNNVFGLSNTAFKTALLRRCLPIPPEAVLVDWFLATTAWLLGARLSFDNATRMDYRQHGANMAHVRPPFAEHQVTRDTERVLRHFEIIRTSARAGTLSNRLSQLENVAANITMFYQKVVLDPECLKSYINAINALDPEPLWWSSVAHPTLQHRWT